MIIAPMFNLPDGSTSQKAYLTTTKEARFFTGVLSEASDNIEVSVRGSAFSADPEMVRFTDKTFIIPNPESYPDGLPLVTGDNVIKLKASVLGGATEEATFVARLVAETSIEPSVSAPTNVRAESFSDYVCITVDKVDSDRVIGYNFYASAASGGAEGYTLLNENPVDTPRVERVENLVSTLDQDVPKQVDADGNALSSPQLLELVTRQRKMDGTVLSTDTNEVSPIPSSVQNMRFKFDVYSYAENETFKFEHSRDGDLTNNLSVAEFSSMLAEQPLFYVVTCVYYDPISGEETESPYSPEVAAMPTVVRPEISNLPTISRESLVKDTTIAIHKVNPLVAVQPGSVLRDLFIDPFVTESLRVRTVIDFLHRATSFPTLLAVDDPLGTGTSIPVASSPYKKELAEAMHLNPASTVQALIDACFDKLAANMGVTRATGTFARGEVTFYTKSAPSSSISIPLGTTVAGGAVFRTTSPATIPLENLASYYNPSTKEYSVTVGVRAVAPGSDSNVGAKQLSSTRLPIDVRNDAPTYGGTNAESNLDLAVRAQNKISSVDTGTERGYLQAAAGLPGVEQVKIISSGDPLMQRDYDADYDKHVGGKVDVWIRGGRDVNISDTFAFTFKIARDIQFELIGAPEFLRFRANDPTLSEQNPILEMLNHSSPKLGMQNASTGEFFDLEGVQITSYNVIELNTDIDQPSVDFGDVVLGDYRYRTGSDYLLERQPVKRITSVVGSTSGEVSPSNYTLIRPSSPLTNGLSAKAGAYLEIQEPITPDGTTSPTGDLITVSNESHLITGDYVEYLGNLGALPLSVQVTSTDGLVEYNGPYDESGRSDFSIIEGTQTSPLGIQRVTGSRIKDGETVLISYSHDENFTVNYVSNLMVMTAQEDMDALKHLTADVLCKETTEVFVNVGATVVTKRGYAASTVDASVRTALAALFGNLQLGEPIRQSDVIEALDSSLGVAYVVMPLVKMCLADGSQVVREVINVGVYGDFALVPQWSNGTTNVYLLTNPFVHSTTDGGGAEFGDFVGVFKNDAPLQNATVLPSLLGREPNQSYIIGNDGIGIPGYSDQSTIRSQGYVTAEEISARRAELTKNRVLVSLPVGQTPDQCSWAVTYTTSGDDGASDLEIGPSSYFSLGEAEFTFDEDRANTRFRGSDALGSRGRSY